MEFLKKIKDNIVAVLVGLAGVLFFFWRMSAKKNDKLEGELMNASTKTEAAVINNDIKHLEEDRHATQEELAEINKQRENIRVENLSNTEVEDHWNKKK